jgi:putative membrane protein
MLHQMDGSFMGLGWLFWIIIVALIVWLGLSVSRRYHERNIEKGEDQSALDILKKRYARGEISQEEFEQKKSELS